MEGNHLCLIEILSEYMSGELRETTKDLRVAGVLAKIRTRHLPNTGRDEPVR
jgi:hypothetical protein